MAGFLASEPRKSRRGDWSTDTIPQPNRKSGFQRLDDVRAAVADFVERYNQSWRLEKLGYQTPIEAREAYELRPAT